MQFTACMEGAWNFVKLFSHCFAAMSNTYKEMKLSSLQVRRLLCTTIINVDDGGDNNKKKFLNCISFKKKKTWFLTT